MFSCNFKKYLFLFAVTFIFISGLSAGDFKGDIKKLDSYILKCREGSQDKPARYQIKPSSGKIDSSFWQKLAQSLDSKSNCIFYVNLSALSVAEGKENEEIPYNSITSVKSLGGIKLPCGLTSVSSYSFSSCANLEYVYFPQNTIHHIGYQSFSSCPLLKDVYLYDFDGYLDEAFKYCDSLKVVHMPDHPIYCSSSGGYYQHSFGNTPVESVVTPSKTFTYEEWVAYNRIMVPEYVAVKEVRASSVLEDKYKESNICNAGYECWVEGSPGDGKGEWIELILEKPVTINMITVKNGFGNLSYYWKNNRIKKALFIFDGDEKNALPVEFRDNPSAESIYIGKYDSLCSKVKIVIEDVYQGSLPDNDCCIDEICINAAIDRQRVYGAYYSSDEVIFRYDPERKRMLKGLYEIDVGSENVKEKDGFILARAVDWESGEKYWTRPNFSLRGTMLNGFFPGTGGGHSINEYAMFLNPDGRHYLFTWHEETAGCPISYDPCLEFYVWENQTWNIKENMSGEKSLENAYALLKKIEGRPLGFRFSIDDRYYTGDYSMTFNIYPVEKPSFAVTLELPYENSIFMPYEKTAEAAAAFGSSEDFKNDGSLYEKLEKCKAENTNLLLYSAAFNEDPAMSEYLIKCGFAVTGQDVEDDYYGDKSMSALEAWKYGGNNNQVSSLLLKHGASYSEKMLISAFDRDNRAEFEKTAALVTSYNETLNHITFQIGREDNEKLKYYFSVLKKLNVDFEEAYKKNSSEKGYSGSPMEVSINMRDLDMAKYFLSLGMKIPEHMENNYGYTPLCYLGDKYTECMRDRDYYRASNDSVYAESYAKAGKNAMDMILWLFSQGVSAGSCNLSGKNILHIFASEKIDGYALEIVRLYIKHGLDLNGVSKGGEHPLEVFLEETYRKKVYSWDSDEDDYITEYSQVWTKEEMDFQNILLDSGAWAEYALYYLIREYDTADLLDKNKITGRTFNWYFDKAKGRNIIANSMHYNDTNEKSVVLILLEKYKSDPDSSSILIKKFLDAGYSVDGIIYYNREWFGFEYFLFESFSYCDLNGEKSSSYKEIFKLLMEREDKAKVQAALDKVFEDLLSNIYFDILPEDLFEKVSFLIECGADWNKKVEKKYEDRKVVRCPDLLVSCGPDIWDFPFEYLEETAYDDDYEFYYDESKMTEEDFKLLDEGALPYIKTCRYLIELGAGDVLTEKAFKKAKVPARVYKRILK
ncbi:leucine-rich repeat protein [Treponema sp.]|uniref:NADase-type glycan-binding domain-containing protein n=1 Tax=Treponema sp. TaxID=166 RepID=UPI0025EAF0EE|nr:leucine-rich repeat protein [Treponema sp.]MCR5217531.1 leucine-rich repeat protein [Treponema sp.]